jgi:hypothetical protein
VALVLFIILFRLFFRHPKNIPAELFSAALRTENDGDYEAAIVTYENALQEFGKSNFRSSSLKNRINARLKVLHTLIDYRKNVRFTR